MNWFDSLTSLPIDTTNPVVSGHPLNRGRVAWWLTLPAWYGGRQWVDLMGLNHGTLASMGSSGGWRGTTRPGGWGNILYDGTGYLLAGNSPSLGVTSNYTLSAWVMRATGTRGKIVAKGDGTVEANSVYVFDLDATFHARTYIENNPTTQVSGATVLSANTWYHLVATRTTTAGNGIFSIYVNGKLDGTTTDSNNTLAAVTSQLLGIGAYNDGVLPFTGTIDDVSIFNRTLSGSEVNNLYVFSQQGYPGVLRRVVPWSILGRRGGLLMRRRRMAAA